MRFIFGNNEKQGQYPLACDSDSLVNASYLTIESHSPTHLLSRAFGFFQESHLILLSQVKNFVKIHIVQKAKVSVGHTGFPALPRLVHRSHNEPLGRLGTRPLISHKGKSDLPPVGPRDHRLLPRQRKRLCVPKGRKTPLGWESPDE